MTERLDTIATNSRKVKRLLVVHWQWAYFSIVQVDAFVFEHLHPIPLASSGVVELEEETKSISGQSLIM